MCDLDQQIGDEGLEFIAIGQTDHPRGSLTNSLKQLRHLEGFAALRFTIQEIAKTTEMICRDAPASIRKAGVEALLVDQTEPAGGSVADHLGLPFVTVCNALALNREAAVPPPFTPWRYSPSLWARARNRMSYLIFDRMMRPVLDIVQSYRKKWSLQPLQSPEDSFSGLLQISQQPSAFDFPRMGLPSIFHYVGPLRNSNGRAIPFPWERLDDRRALIYASLGTLQSGKEHIFRYFAEACLELDAQLVISHAHGLRSGVTFPGNTLVVEYAPQLELLSHARLTLTHAGLNTVLDSLTCGVPLVAVPITYEQPAIASRIRWAGVGEVVPLRKLRTETLRAAIRRVLNNNSYYRRAQDVRTSIHHGGGVRKAADLIEQTVASPMTNHSQLSTAPWGA